METRDTSNKHSSSLVKRTLWRIETNLDRAPTLADLAVAEGVSRFHLTRAFGLATGQSLMAYVRARRLTVAAERLLATQESVLSIALDAGYDSHEGFSRAFRGVFGMSPIEARVSASDISGQEPLEMTDTVTPFQPPRFETHPGMRLVGQSDRFTPETRPSIPGLWDRVVEEFGPSMMDTVTFGVCHDFDGHDFTYFVGMADDGGAAGLPETLRIPEGKYAVFDHPGHISTISETWSSIFETWLPGAGVSVTDGPEFECYAKDFSPEGEGRVSIWIPVADA